MQSPNSIRLRFAALVLALLGVELQSCFSASERFGRPNIVVFFTDDHGYGDLSCQDVLGDIRTPSIDALANSGVRALHGYSTAPQCVPSRAGLLIGKFQSRFGLEANGRSLDGFNQETTIAQRLQSNGYVTGQFGKWHLGPTPEIPKHGFQYVYSQNSQAPFAANMDESGQKTPMQRRKPMMYHVDACSHAAAAVIRKHHKDSLFLYIAYRAPHVPLDAPAQYLNRFPGKMPERRRQALAMLSAVDDGVGLVMQTLEEFDLRKNTLVFFIGDNGAPLKIHKADAPGGGPGWDGSLNDPLNGEKGMLSEGGMHTPFVVSWPAQFSGGQQYRHPISALDVAATAAAAAGIETQTGDLDGVDLTPFLSGRKPGAPHEALMWRWVSQSAIREGDWKLLRGGEREFLYNLREDLEEKKNLLAAHPEIADRLRRRLRTWSKELSPPGLIEKETMSKTWNQYFDYYLEGKPAPPQKAASVASRSGAAGEQRLGAWLLRNGQLEKTKSGLRISAGKAGRKQAPFLTRNGLELKTPVKVSVRLSAATAGKLGVSWRRLGQRDFRSEEASEQQSISGAARDRTFFTIPDGEPVVHIRILLPAGNSMVSDIEIESADGRHLRLDASGEKSW